MTYCVAIQVSAGLVYVSDSRTNAGYDQVNVCRKMYTFVTPGERVVVKGLQQIRAGMRVEPTVEPLPPPAGS